MNKWCAVRNVFLSMGFLIFFYGTAGASGKIEIIASSFPVYDFARQVGKDRVNVRMLLPPGVEAHSFEPRPRDISRIESADIFIYTNDIMEPWARRISRGMQKKDSRVIDAGRDAVYIAASGEEKEHFHSGGKDPHIWLDFSNVRIMVNAIADGLIAADPAGKAYYAGNAEAFNRKITALDESYTRALSKCEHSVFIHCGHFAFNYLTARYGLEYISPYKGFNPEAEPTPRNLAELVDAIRARKVKYIYYEELLSPKLAEVIANETHVSLLCLQTAHNLSSDDFAKGVTFMDIMNKNLKNLIVGLECHE